MRMLGADGADRYRLNKAAICYLSFGQIVPDCRPDYFQIDKEILMDRHVGLGAHLRPRKPGMLLDKVRRNAVDLVHGLADDLDVANNGVLNLRVLLKSCEVRHRLKVAC